MKIIGGEWRGRNFFIPEGIRPTQNIVRKAIFDICGQELDGKICLDLFAGSGAMGLEALSRKAKKVVFVEKDEHCLGILLKNIELFGGELTPESVKRYEILRLDGFAAVKHLYKEKREFDMVIIDPPYGRDLGKKALKVFSAYDILHPNCVVIIEHHRRDFLPEQAGELTLSKRRTYGTTSVSIFQKNILPESE